jgi:hypothetical protein
MLRNILLAGAIIPEAQNVNAVVTYTITYP